MSGGLRQALGWREPLRAGDLLAVLAFGLLVLATVPAFARTYADEAWQQPALGAALVVGTVVVALRALRLPGVLALPVTLAAALAATSALLLPDGGWWPSAERREALAELWRLGVVELEVTPAPAPSLEGLVLLTGVGLVLVTVLGLELLLRWRRPGLAVTAVAALWTVPLAVPMSAESAGSIRALVFLAAAALLLLLAPTANRPDPPAVTSPTALSTGVAMAAGAVALGVVFPGLLPGADDPPWVRLGSGSEPRGYQPIVDVSQRLRAPEDRDLLRVLAPRRTYLRLAGLDSFDGSTWRLGPTTGGSFEPDPERLFAAVDLLPPEQPAAVTEPLAVEVEVLELDNIYVPTPYQPTQVLGPEREDMVWSTQGGFLATWDVVEGRLGGGPRVGIREGVSYRIQAARPTPTRDDLAQVSVDPDTLEELTRLPREYPALAAQAEQVYAEAGATTTIDRVLALQDWFVRSDAGFTYDLDVPPMRDEEALERFVLEDRVGYCESYATAMAVMLRATGIPARVAVGFLPGRVTREPGSDAASSIGDGAGPAPPTTQGTNGQEQTQTDGDLELTEFTVSTSDAHAWVEVLFPGYGWITFEPTPRDDQSQIVPRADDLAPWDNEEERIRAEREQAAANAEVEATDGPDGPDLADLLPDEDRDAAAGTDAGDGAAGGTLGAATRGPGLAAAALLVAGAGVLVALRRRGAGAGVAGRSSPSPEGAPDCSAEVLRAQDRLLRTAEGLGLARRPSETMEEVLERWRAQGRLATTRPEDLVRLVSLTQRAAFGGVCSAGDLVDAERISATLRAGLVASVSLGTRLLAPLRRAAAPLLRRRSAQVPAWAHGDVGAARIQGRVPAHR